MKYIIEFKSGGRWWRSGNKTSNGIRLDTVEFDNKYEAQAEADRQQDIMGNTKYRVTEIDKGEKMKIGEHEVTNITRDKVKVGCQEVTRSEIEAVLEKMKAAAAFTLRVGTGRSGAKPGDVWLDQRDGAVRVMVLGNDGTGAFAVTDLTPEGIRRHGYFIETVGLALETGVNGKTRVVKLLE